MCLYSGLHFIFSSVQINYFLLHQQNTHSLWIIFGILILDQLVNVCHEKTKSVQAPRAFLWYEDCWSSRVRHVRVLAWTVRNCKGHFWQFLILYGLNSVAVSSRSPNLYALCSPFCAIGAKVYERVKRMREDERRKRTMLCDVLQYIQDGRACQQWLSKQAAM